MFAGNWNRLSWWQKTSLTAFLFSICGIVPAIIVVVFVSTLAESKNLSSVSWLAFSAFPLLIVFLVASLARVQQRINLKWSQSRPGKPSMNGDHRP